MNQQNTLYLGKISNGLYYTKLPHVLVLKEPLLMCHSVTVFTYSRAPRVTNRIRSEHLVVSRIGPS